MLCVAGGYKLPKGQDVMISIYNLHHSPAGGPRKHCQHGLDRGQAQAVSTHRSKPARAPSSATMPCCVVNWIGSADSYENSIPSPASVPPAVWDDPEEFQPERFPLDGPVPTEQNTDYRYIPFSAGPRCVVPAHQLDTCRCPTHCRAPDAGSSQQRHVDHSQLPSGQTILTMQCLNTLLFGS
jgi:Cytochrome P450